MPKVSAKRQITLPVEQCREAHIQPGDEYESFVDNNGFITIVKKTAGSAYGLLKDIEIDPQITEQASLQSAIEQ